MKNSYTKINRYVFIFICILGCFSSFAFADSDSDVPSSVDTEQTAQEQVITDNVSVTPLKVSANSTTGLQSIILSLIGDYNPIVTDHTYTQGSGYTYHEISITPDWSWICSCGLFIIVLYCTFRLIGQALERV